MTKSRKHVLLASDVYGLLRDIHQMCEFAIMKVCESAPPIKVCKAPKAKRSKGKQ